jgi:cysteine-rich repeat protein
VWIVFGVGLLLAPELALGQAGPPREQRAGHWRAAQSGDPLGVAVDQLRRNRSRFGLSTADVDAVHVLDRYRARESGITHLYLRQRVAGIDVFDSDVTVSVDPRGRIYSRDSNLVADAEGRANAQQPLLGAAEAISRAAEHLGLEATAPQSLRTPGGVAREEVFLGGAVSKDEIPVKLEYVPLEGADIRLAWNLVIRMPNGRHWWNLHVDAVTGEVLRQNDWIAHASYRVFPFPQKSPDEGATSVEVDPAELVASPYGWHDTDGSPGAEFTDTRGNNVYAQEDLDASNSGGARPDGGAGLDFVFGYDAAVQPGSYEDTAITNLFYWNNRIHDILYHYGFDEAAGNFQQNNYGNGGAGSDPVQADAQDGAATDNANFGTPPDGSDPRMQMFRWLHPSVSPGLTVHSPAPVAGGYSATQAFFGGGTLGLNGDLLKAIPADACSTLTNPTSMAGKIALIDRGSCTFVEKTRSAQVAGAIGAIIVNNAGDVLVGMSGVASDLEIPALFIGQSNGQAIEAQLGSGVNATLVTPAVRDSDLDSGVIIHEYGHGVSNRLTGGPSNVNCLTFNQSQGMGEGWGDWLAMALTAEASDQETDAVGMGNYLDFQPVTGPGIRTHSYSTSFAINDLSYVDIGSLSVPHGVGEVWAVALWEMYWNLVDVYGFDPDLIAGSGGNNIALQLVISGMKLQGCHPTFIAARDAIIAADQADTGANECLIWEAFAKRGLGEFATDGGGVALLSVVEDYSEPAQCVASCGDSLLQVGETCDDGNANFFDGCAPSCSAEQHFDFSGTATGGTIDLTLNGVNLQVVTLLGESAAQVAANVAAAINANASLMALGVTAASLGDEVATSGDLTTFEVNDPGLGGPALPALSNRLRWLLAAALILVIAWPLYGRGVGAWIAAPKS